MPSRSKAQQHLMAAAEHGASFPMARKVAASMTHSQMHDFEHGGQGAVVDLVEAAAQRLHGPPRQREGPQGPGPREVAMAKFPKAKTPKPVEPDTATPDAPTAVLESAPPIVKPKVVGKSQFGPVQTDNKQKP